MTLPAASGLGTGRMVDTTREPFPRCQRKVLIEVTTIEGRLVESVEPHVCRRVEQPGPPEPLGSPRSRKRAMRHPPRAMTPEDERRILELWDEGWSLDRIRQEVRRSLWGDLPGARCGRRRAQEGRVIDLAAERDAAVSRLEKADAEKWLAIRSRRLRTEGASVSIEAARELWPGKSDAELAEIVDRARADIEERAMGRKKIERWPKDEMIARGAELFREHPEATAALVYEMLEREANGRQLCAEGTWTAVWAAEARKLAGVDGTLARAAGHRRYYENGGGQGSGREGTARPEGGTPAPRTASPGRTDLPRPVTQDPVLQKPDQDSPTPDDQELRAAARALLDSVEGNCLGGFGGSWLWFLADDRDAMHCLRLRKALGMELPDELVELREVLG